MIDTAGEHVAPSFPSANPSATPNLPRTAPDQAVTDQQGIRKIDPKPETGTPAETRTPAPRK